jgi:large subunit ribosomal protein L32
MSVPAKRRPTGAGGRRGLHLALKKIKTVACPKCKKPKLPHVVCSYCGTYKNREVLKSKLDKKEEKKLAKRKVKSAEKQQNH